MDSRIAHWLAVRVENFALRNGLFIILMPAIIFDYIMLRLLERARGEKKKDDSY